MTMNSEAIKFIYWLLVFNAFCGLRCEGFEEKLFPVPEQVSRCREGQFSNEETSTKGGFSQNIIREVDSTQHLTPGTGKEKLETEFVPAPRWSNVLDSGSSGRDQGSKGRSQDSNGRGEFLSQNDASYFVDKELEERVLGDKEKRNVGMLRMGKRPFGILRMRRDESEEGVEEDSDRKLTDGDKEPRDNDNDDDVELGRGGVGMLRMDKRPVELLRMGKRPVGLLRMGKRPVNLLRMGKRPVDLLRMGKRPVNLLRMGKRPVDLLRMG